MKTLLFIIVLFAVGKSFSQTADFTSSQQSVCIGGSIQFFDASTGATSWSWSFIDGGSGQTSSLQNPTVTYMIPGTYSVILTVTNGISSDTEIKTSYITVVNSASLTLTSAAGTDNQTVCKSDPIASINYTMIGATGITTTGLPVGINANLTTTPTGGNISIVGSTSIPGVYPYTITTTGANCAPVSVSGTITVESPAALALTSAVGTDAQSVCLLNGIVPIEYTFGGSATGVTFSGLPSGLTTSVVGNVLTISGNPSTAGIFNFTITTTGGSCTPEFLTGTLNVDQTPTLVLSSALGTDNPTVCEGTGIVPISWTIGGSATGATVSGLPAGLTDNVSGSTITISGSASTNGVFPYTVTTTGGACASTNYSGTITIDQLPTITLISAAGTDLQTICESFPITTIDYAIGGSATGASASGLPAGVSATFASGTLSITGTPTLPGVYPYTITTSGGTCAPVTISGTINVDGNHTIALISALGTDNQTVCENTPITSIDYTLGGSATGVTSSGLPAGVSASVVGSLVNLTGSPMVAGVYAYTLTTTGGTCPATSISGTISVDVSPTVSLTSAIGTDAQVLCEGSPLNSIDYAIGGSATGATASGLPVGVNANFAAGTLSISGTPTGSGSYSYTISTTGGACPSVSTNGTIQVDATHSLVLISSVGTDVQTICENTPIANIQYKMGGSATSATVVGLPMGVNYTITTDTITISGIPVGIGSFPYTVTTSGGTCSPISLNGQLDVLPAPTLAIDPGFGTQNQVVCHGTPINDIVVLVGGSATGATVTGLPVGLTANFAAGSLTISGTSSAAGNYTFTVQSTGGPCSSVSLTGNLDIQGTNILLTSPSFTNYQHVCLGTAIDTITYQTESPVTVNDLPAGVTATFIPGAPNTLILAGTPIAQGANYYTIQSASGCGNNIIVGSIETITVQPGNNSGSPISVCEGSDFDLTPGILWSLETVYLYEWQVASNPAGPYVSASGDNSSANYTGNLNLGDTMVYFRRVITDGVCSDTALPVLVQIDSLPTIQNSGFATLCSQDSLTISGINVNNGVITSWVNPGSGQLLNANTANPTFVPGQGDKGSTINLAFVVSSNNTCSPETIIGNFPVTILDDPDAVLNGSATICANNTAVNINGASMNGATYEWQQNGNGSLSDTTTLMPVYHAVIADTNSTVTVSLIAHSSAACINPLSDTATFTISVLPYGINPLLAAFAGDDQTISLGESVQMNADGIAITNWSWTPALELTDSTSSNPVATPTQTTTFVLTVIDINGCIDQDSVKITVIEDFSVFVPNLFSPNGDGFNDTWEIPELSFYPNTQVTIINREGRLVYSSDNYDNSWDGTFEGKPLPEATYYYLLKFENSDKEYKGAVSILRNKK